MVTATKPDGNVVVVDTDWSSLESKALNVEENKCVSRFFSNRLPNGGIANNLQSYFNNAGLVDVKVNRIKTQLSYDDYSVITQKYRFFKDCFPDSTQYKQVMHHADQHKSENDFASIDSVIVSGKKPS